MENKYYTPDISEFHLGFEYERIMMYPDIPAVFDKDTDTPSWVKFTFNFSENPLNILNHLQSYLDSNQIRVKYLDKEDFDVLGWNLTGDTYQIDDWSLSGQIQYGNIEIEREFDDRIMGEHHKRIEMCFKGKIKNKSELKTVMNLLGIKL